MNKLRCSLDFQRKAFNREVKDVMEKDMVKDVLASETAGSVYVPKKKAKSPSKKRPRAAS